MNLKAPKDFYPSLFQKTYKVSSIGAFRWNGYLPNSRSKAEYFIDIQPIIVENKYHRLGVQRLLIKCKNNYNLCNFGNSIHKAIGEKLLLYPPTHQISIRVKYDYTKMRYIFFTLLSFNKVNCSFRECSHILGNWLLINMDKFSTDYLLTPTPDNIEWYYQLVIARIKPMM